MGIALPLNFFEKAKSSTRINSRRLAMAAFTKTIGGKDPWGMPSDGTSTTVI